LGYRTLGPTRGESWIKIIVSERGGVQVKNVNQKYIL
jgi:hypothetical protein